jgi:hypothetical protein
MTLARAGLFHWHAGTRFTVSMISMRRARKAGDSG